MKTNLPIGMNGFLKISSPNFDSQIVTKMDWSDMIGIWVTLLWEQIWNSFYRRWYLQHIFCPSWETRSKLTTDWFLEKVFLKIICPAMSPIILGRAKSLLFAKWFTDSFCLYKSDKYEPKSFDFNSFLTARPVSRIPEIWNQSRKKSRLSSIFVTQEKKWFRPTVFYAEVFYTS